MRDTGGEEQSDLFKEVEKKNQSTNWWINDQQESWKSWWRGRWLLIISLEKGEWPLPPSYSWRDMSLRQWILSPGLSSAFKQMRENEQKEDEEDGSSRNWTAIEVMKVCEESLWEWSWWYAPRGEGVGTQSWSQKDGWGYCLKAECLEKHHPCISTYTYGHFGRRN